MPTQLNVVAIVPLSIQTIQAITTYRNLYKQLSDMGVEPLFGVDIGDDLPKNHPQDLYSSILGFPVSIVRTCSGGNPYIVRNTLAGTVASYAGSALWFLDGDCIIKDPAKAREMLSVFTGTKKCLWGGEVTTSYEGLTPTPHFKELAASKLELYAGHSLPGVILGASMLIQSEDFVTLGRFRSDCKSGGDAALSWKASDAGFSVDPHVEALDVKKTVFSMTMAGLVAKQFRRGRMCKLPGTLRTEGINEIRSKGLRLSQASSHAEVVDSLMALIFTLGLYSSMMDEESPHA